MNFKKILAEGLDDTLNDIKNLKSSESGQPQQPTNPATTPQSNITVARYKNSRNFGVWRGTDLIVVAVYQKGAENVKRILDELKY